MISQLPQEQLQKGVICASAGNHAQGVALSAKRLKTTAAIVMPTTTPQIKVHYSNILISYSLLFIFSLLIILKCVRENKEISQPYIKLYLI